jgi:hypothetical protein
MNYHELLGLEYENQESNEDCVTQLMDCLASFRDKIKCAAKDKDLAEIFRVCDSLRDDNLMFLGFKLEDKSIG